MKRDFWTNFCINMDYLGHTKLWLQSHKEPVIQFTEKITTGNSGGASIMHHSPVSVWNDRAYKCHLTKPQLALQTRDNKTQLRQIYKSIHRSYRLMVMCIFCSPSLSLLLTHHRPKSLNLPYTDHILSSGSWRFDLIKLIFLLNYSLPSSQRSCFNQPERREENVSSASFSIWPNCTAAKRGLGWVAAEAPG